jgi:CTP:molybdopterin cytidylyltransferase MocA
MGQAQFLSMPGIVLAGGRSARMGRPKAVLTWPGSTDTFVSHVTATLRDGGSSPVAVVTGEHHELITAALAGSGVTVLFNPRHPEGQLTSLLHGLRWAFAHTTGAWVLSTLVDAPAVRAATVRTIIQAALDDPSWAAVRPISGDRHGHPVVWRRDVLPLLEAADPALGARVVMRALAASGRVREVPVDDPGAFTDVDTPEDYASLLRGA